MRKLILFLLVIPTLLFGQSDWYVSPTGNDVTGDGSEGNPWQTWTHAHDQASGGDTIYFMAGDHIWDVPVGGFVVTKSLSFKGIIDANGVVPRVLGMGLNQCQIQNSFSCSDNTCDFIFERLIWVVSTFRAVGSIGSAFMIHCNSFKADQVAFIGYSDYSKVANVTTWDFGAIMAKEDCDFKNCVFMNWYYGITCQRAASGYTPIFNFVNCSWTRHYGRGVRAAFYATVNLSFCNRYNLDGVWYDTYQYGVVNESNSLNVDPNHIMTHSANNRCYRLCYSEWANSGSPYVFSPGGCSGYKWSHYGGAAGPNVYIYPGANVAIDADTYKYLYFSGVLLKTTGDNASRPFLQWTKNGVDWFTAPLTLEDMTRWDDATNIQLAYPEYASLDLNGNADWSGTVLLVRFGWFYDADAAMALRWGRLDYILFAETVDLPDGSAEKLRTVSELIDGGNPALFDDHLGDDVFIGQGEQESDVGVYGGIATEGYVAGWAGKVNTVSNPGKVNTVEKANIAKINTVQQ